MTYNHKRFVHVSIQKCMAVYQFSCEWGAKKKETKGKSQSLEILLTVFFSSLPI